MSKILLFNMQSVLLREFIHFFIPSLWNLITLRAHLNWTSHISSAQKLYTVSLQF